MGNQSRNLEIIKLEAKLATETKTNAAPPVVYAAAKKAFGLNGFGEIKLPKTGDVAFINEHTKKWEHQYRDGSEMPADQWMARAWDQIGA